MLYDGGMARKRTPRSDARVAGKRPSSERSAGTRGDREVDRPARTPPLALLVGEMQFGEGARTTLRVPDAVAVAASTLAGEIGTSKNDAIMRLALVGARVVERAREVAEKRDARWGALVAAADRGGKFPDAEEMRVASFALRDSGD